MTVTLVPLPAGTCPECGDTKLRRREVEQATLFLHGGYGGWQRRVWRYCRCGWRLLEVEETTRPGGSVLPRVTLPPSSRSEGRPRR